jgi:adenosyl cobinamide kinase/adenosyl cobinamide phosphate guanylyltransferase
MCSNVYDGIGVISSVYGFSGFEPNTVLMGWPKKPLNNSHFETLISNLESQDYNIAFLKYDTHKKFGNHDTIDIWWSGAGNVLPLALHLVRFITSTPVWRRAKLRILVVNNSLKNYERYHSAASELLEDLRIEGDVKIINNVEGAPVREVIRAESADTDLIISEILSLDGGNIPSAIAKTNSLVADIGTAIFLRASSFFEDVTVLPAKIPATPESSKATDKEISPILSVTLPREEPLSSYVRVLAEQMDSAAVKFSESTLENIREENEILYDQIDTQLEKEAARIYALDSIKDKKKREEERKKILMEFGEYILNLLEDYKITSLKARMKAMDKGIELFLRESMDAVKRFPAQVTLQFDKEDYLRIKPKTLGQKLRKSLVLLRFNIHSKKISFKVRTDSIVYHYMYYKRLRATEFFYEHFSSESLSFMPMIRELEKFFNEGDTARYKNEYIPDIMATLAESRESTREFIERYKVKQYNDIASDINNITAVLQNPHVNILSGRLRSINKGAKDIKERLEEFPSIWEKYIYSHVNRCKLDFIYLTIKERISLSVHKTLVSVESRIGSSLMAYIGEFRQMLEQVSETGEVGHLSKSPVMPAIDTLFTSLMNDIEDAVNSADEEVVTGSNTIPEKITISYMDEAPEYTVPLRKLADYHVSNKLSNTVAKESYDLIDTCRNVITSLKNIHKLASFSFNPVEDDQDDPENDVVDESELKRKGMCESLVSNLDGEREKLLKAITKLSSALKMGLTKAFEPLNAVEITSSHNKIKKIKADKRSGGVTNKLSRGYHNVVDYLSRQFGNLLYKQSEGMIWAGKLDKEAGTSFHTRDNFSAMIERATPDKSILELLPFYYLNLFTGRSGAGEDFWVGMAEETARVKKAVTRFNMGAKGMLIITGERRSGKSSLSRHLANLYFSGGNVFYVRAPRESASEVSKFDSILAETILKEKYSLNKGYKSGDPLHSLLTSLEGKSVVIVNDLELWWERKPGGTAVVERIIELMQNYGDRILFVINVNEISLNVINYLTSIRTWALDVVTCRPFSAREIKNFITDRHRAGGLNFVLEGKDENEMTTWDYARFFNHIFQLSGGNPGYSINLWLASIRNISGNTIYLERPEGIDSRFKEAISREDAVFIMQFILHRRFSPDHLAKLLDTEVSVTSSRIRDMFQKGILVEKYPGIYSLNGMLVPFLIERLRSMKLLI